MQQLARRESRTVGIRSVRASRRHQQELWRSFVSTRAIRDRQGQTHQGPPRDLASRPPPRETEAELRPSDAGSGRPPPRQPPSRPDGEDEPPPGGSDDYAMRVAASPSPAARRRPWFGARSWSSLLWELSVLLHGFEALLVCMAAARECLDAPVPTAVLYLAGTLVVLGQALVVLARRPPR
jgi:hypothetical protein